jgi:hypothetical protein
MPTSQEMKVKNTFENVSAELDRYIQVFRSGGLMWKAVDEMGGDTAWLVDVVDALGKAANAVDEANMSTFSNTEESVKEGCGCGCGSKTCDCKEENPVLVRIKSLAGISEASVDQQYADVLATNNQIKINAFLQGLDANTASRLTGGVAQTSKISSDGQSFEPSGEPYVHGQPALSPQTIRMTKPVSNRYKN